MSEWLLLNIAQFAHFHFLRPWWLLALIPLLFTLHYLWQTRNPIGKWRKVIAPHLLKVMLVRHGRASWINPVSVSVLVVVLGIFAMAGPTWKQQPSPFSEDIAALVVVLDASSSMKQVDIQPSRLERAKQKIQDLLALRPGGRVGLIVYAGSAHSVIPLTNDADVINNFLNAIVTEMMPRKGKFPEKALPIADQMLRDSPVPGTVLMIGDGISPNTNENFSQYFSSKQHQLLVLGIGSDSAVIDDKNNGLIPLEVSALTKLASNSDGYYQSMTIDKEDVKKLNRRINHHLVIVDDGSRPWVDAGYYLLFPIAYVKDDEARWGLIALAAIDKRASLLEASRILEKSGVDPYVFVRDAYYQVRQNQIYDGNPPSTRIYQEPTQEDLLLEDELEKELQLQ